MLNRWNFLKTGFYEGIKLEVLGQALDPEVQAALADPKIRGLVADPTVLSLLADPRVQQILITPLDSLPTLDPDVQQVMADPLIQGLLSDPTVLTVFTNPQLLALLANPSAMQLLLNPAVGRALAHPAGVRVLTDPGVQQLLSDPSALRLAIDPRTVKLLADPIAPPLVQVPVLIRQEVVATDSESDRIFLIENVATTRVDTGEEMEDFTTTHPNLVVDRRTKVYLEGTEGGRTGGLSFPFHTNKDGEYPLWIDAAGQPLVARFTSKEDVDGLSVLVFKIDEKDNRSLGNHPGLGLPLVLDSDMTFRVEPRTGRVIDVEDHSTIVSLDNPKQGKLPLFVSDIEYTPETVRAQIEAAKEDRRRLAWFGSTLPWMAIGIGVLLTILGASLFLLPRFRRAQA